MCCQDGCFPVSLSGPGRTSRNRAGNTQTRRSTTTATNVDTHSSTTSCRGTPLASTSAMIQRACRPISRKTEFSSRNEMVRQFSRSAIRDVAVCRMGALCPSSRPAITTASTPEPWISSAAT